ncbi:hypothetical protein Bca101_048412 [Brassica carinata]
MAVVGYLSFSVSLDSSLVSLSRRRLLFPSVDLWFLSLSVALPSTATELPLGVSPRRFCISVGLKHDGKGRTTISVALLRSKGEDKVKTVSRSGAIRVSAFVVFGVLCHVVSVSRQYHRVEQSESISL